MKKYFIIYIITVCCSCKKNNDQPFNYNFDFGPNVVCFLADDKPFVELELSKPVYLDGPPGFHDKFDVITDATVEIVNGNISYALVFDDSTYKYRVDTMQLKIRKGQTYYLNITLADGKNVRSTCIIPSDIYPAFTSEAHKTGEQELTYSISWNDEDKEKYYFFSFKADFNNTHNFNHEVKVLPFRKSQGIKDVLISKVEKIGWNVSDDNYKINPYLTTVDIYNYYQSIYNNSTDDPAAQAFPVYTNITGGIGIFGPMISR